MNNQQGSTTSSDKKKPGRKPTSTSPALRKAQNRAAQRAFRERKEKHIVELEAASKQLREQRDKLMTENKELRSHVGVLGYEGWHLKGAMLSLQLMCFMNYIAIPDHSPYLDQQQHSLANESIHPGVISAYNSACKRNTPPSFSSSNNKKHPPHDRKSDNKDQTQHYLSTGSILVYKDSIQTVVGNRITTRIRATPPPQPSAPLPPSSADSSMSLSSSSSSSETSETPVLKQHSMTTTTTSSSSPPGAGQHRVSNRRASLHNNDATSPDCTSATTGEDEHVEKRHHGVIAMDEDNDEDEDEAVFSARPIMLTREPIPSFNMASLQTLQLRHKLQAASSKMESGTFVIKPTVLQTTVPHDPRIDLIPIAAMRDRMILFFELFDLDDCIACILKGIEYKGAGDPSHASSWRFPSQFYEDYWYLTPDYSIDEIRQRWPGLKKMQADGSMHMLLSKAANMSQLALSGEGDDGDSNPLLAEPTTAAALESLFPNHHGRPPQGYPFENFLSSQQQTSTTTDDYDFLPPLESINTHHQQQPFQHRMAPLDHEEEDHHRHQPITLRPPDDMLLDRR